jgi:DNA polymerase I
MTDGKTERPTVFLIDGTAYIHRAYHAIRGLTNSEGLPTNAVFGFTRMLMKLIEEKKPEYAAVFFDAKGPTFRHEIYEAYKANRPPMPRDMAEQIPYIHRVVAGFRLPLIQKTGFEADDLIGTLSERALADGFAVVMVTGDKDFVQLVREDASLWDPMKDKVTDIGTVRESFGIAPERMADVLGLAGDASDNIPGVPGIGQKTAVTLIRQFGSMEGIYENIDAITKKKQKENLIAYRDQAFLSRRLATIETHVELPPEESRPETFRVAAPDKETLFGLFKTLEFSQLQREFPGEAPPPAETDYRAVLTMADLEALVSTLRSAGCFAVDTETTSENPMEAELVGLSFSCEPHRAWYIPCGHHYMGVPEQLPRDTVLSTLKPILEDPGLKKVGQNIKYDWVVLSRCGIELAGVDFDTMVASYLVNPSKRNHNLDQIALDFLNHKTTTFTEVTGGGGKKGILFSEVDVDKATAYACEDADITFRAYEILKERLAEIGVARLMETVEMPLVPVLMKMERRGICVDRDRLKTLSRSFEDELARLEETICDMAGERFNIKSSQQLGVILFERLGLPVQKKTKKKTGYSTDVEVLTLLAARHELPALVLRHRTLSKLKSTYADALLEMCDRETGRIHTSFNQTVTATGRLSSSDPNLQNIPIRDEEGRQIRTAFIPREGWRLLAADYSQIELRILAHYSEDPILIESFEKEEDIHTRTAAEVFQVAQEGVTPELRRQAKAINFGIIYGMSAHGLSQQLGISRQMAGTYIDHYFDRYKGVKRFMEGAVEDARKTRRTSTLLGRIRLLPEIDSANRNVRQFAERIALNTPIQGTAADLLKLAMIRVEDAVAEKAFQSAMLLTVHDELIFESPPGELDDLETLVKEIMEGVWDLRVPLKVNVGVGDNWTEAH